MQKHIRTQYTDGDDVLSNVRNSQTNQTDTYTKVAAWVDGSAMNDSKVDNVIYRKVGDDYFRWNFNTDKTRALILNATSDFAGISVRDGLLLRLSYYNQVTVLDPTAGGIFKYRPLSDGLTADNESVFSITVGSLVRSTYNSRIKDVTALTVSSDVDNVSILNIESKRWKANDYNAVSRRYGSETNVWIKMAEFDLGSQSNQDFAATIQITTSHARNQSITLFVCARNATTGNAPFFMNVDVLGFNNGTFARFFDMDSFKLINAGFGSVYELWGKKVSSLGRYAIKELNLVAGGTVSRTYFDFQAHQVAEPTATYEIASSALMVSPNAQAARMVSPHTGRMIYYRRSTIYRDGSTITDADVDGITTIKRYGVYFHVVRHDINMQDLGAQSLSDATALFTKVINKIVNIGEIYCPAGAYRVRNLIIPTERVLKGSGEKTMFRMARTNNAANSTDYIVRSTGTLSEIRDLRIDGENLVGNGLLISPEDGVGGMKRAIRNIKVDNFRGYVASPTGSGFGVGGAYARADLENVIGGNGIICGLVDAGGQAWELLMDGIRVSGCDGVGLDVGNCNDSKFNNIWIGDSIKGGFFMARDNQNNQVSNIKVFRCRMPKIPPTFDDSVGTLEPYSLTSEESGAIILTGGNNQLNNIEAQENGDHGILIGTTQFSLRFSSITNLIADGNGGIIEGDLNNADYRRSGILLKNYYKIKVQGVSQDFRAKVNTIRQQNGFSIINSLPFITLSSQIRRGMWYKIKTITGGADFTLIQGTDLNTKSNAVGFQFMVSADFTEENSASLYATAMGSGGQLQAVNDHLYLDLIISDTYDQIANEGPGYVLGALPGTNSVIIVNGKYVNGTY